MKFKVKVKTDIRSEASLVKGTKYGVLEPGFMVDIVQEVKETNSENIWLKDANGFFYKKEALEEVLPESTNKPLALDSLISKIPNWNSHNFDVTRFWTNTTGKGIKIAVIDSGIFPHKDLLEAIDRENEKTFSGDSIIDSNGHGTHVAGIIAARGISNLYGVAPDSIIVPIKVGQPPFENDILVKAVRYAASLQEVKIINMSLRANSIDTVGLENLGVEIERAINNGKIIVAAVGDKYRKTIYYPAKFKNVIAVSAVKRDIKSNNESYVVRRMSNYGLPERTVDICAPGVDIISCNIQETGTSIKSGTSMAAAYISGILALKLQQNPTVTAYQISQEFHNSIFQYSLREGETNGIKLPVINPELFLNKFI